MTKMKLIIIILNKEEHLDELLEGLVGLDVRGATIIDSVGMGQIIAHDLPVFGGLRSLISGARPYNKMILSVVSVEQVEPITEVFEQICGSLDEPGTGLIFTLPVDFIKGMRKEPLA